MAAPAVEIGVFDDDDSPQADGRPHAPQQVGQAQVLEQEPAEHGVVAAGLVPVVDVQRPELHVAQPACRGRLAGQVELDLIHIDADSSP